MYTGERILPGGIFNVTYQQSLLAYLLVAKLAAGKTVLDVACGEGYGLANLAEVAARVVGIDKDATTIEVARLRYQQPNVTFVQADLFDVAQKLPGEKFDIVCCFQTIEHVTDHDAFLQSLKAMVKPGGKIIVSTPNTNVFHSYNPYHVHEVAAPEIRALFQRHFPTFTLYGVHGDAVIQAYRQSKQKVGNLILKLDVLHARNWLPQPIIEKIYGFISLHVIKKLSHWRHQAQVQKVTQANFTLNANNIEQALDFIVVAEVPA